MLRGVYEDNLKLHRPTGAAPRAPRPRVASWVAIAIAALLIGVMAPVDRMLFGGRAESPSDALQAPTATSAPGASGAPATGSGTGTVASVGALPASATRVIVIDAGHGGRDDGALGRGGLREKDIALDIARRLRDRLARDAANRVYLVREADTFMPLNERVDYVNTKAADAFVSIHADDLPAATGPFEIFYFGQYADARTRDLVVRESQHWSYGIEEYEQLAATMRRGANLPESKALAESIQSGLLRDANFDRRAIADRTPMPAPFVVLFGVKAPGVLVEIGSPGDQREGGLLGDRRYRDDVAAALASGVTDFFNGQSR